jgi:hypothetical protein
MATGDVINYSIRPAKFVERKVIRDMLISLNRFKSITDYKYVGFGSKYFSDFSLFHKTLHINDMVSIEGDVDNKEKYQFNKPFECIEVVMGMSNEALPKIELDKSFIVWLDYDFGIDITMLNDIGFLIENLISGSVVLTSYNSIAHKIGKLRGEFGDEKASHKELLVRKLTDLVTEDYIPEYIPETKLAKAETFSKIVRDIFILKIQNALNDKNSALEPSEKWGFKQIMYFQYKDGADMATLGWVFFQIKDEERIDNCAFEENEFSRNSSDACEIIIPNLTVKEVNRLQNAMPLRGDINREQLPETIYSDDDIMSFSKIYKYYPSFMSVDFA